MTVLLFVQLYFNETAPFDRLKKDTLPRVFLFGGLEGIRTLDPHNANVVRSQLRYKPMAFSLTGVL